MKTLYTLVCAKQIVYHRGFMKYKFHAFYDKSKKQFILVSWKVGEIILREIPKIDEYASYFN